MPTLTTTRTAQDGNTLFEADLDAPLDSIETWANVTKLNDDNLQDSGITGSTKLVNASVTAAKLAPGSVTSTKVTHDIVNGHAALTYPAADDEILIGDTSATALKKLAFSDVRRMRSASKTAAYTATVTDDILYVDTTTAFTITLPTAATFSGRTLIIVKTTADFNACTIDADAAETIDGATTTTVNTQNEIVELYSNGTTWTVLRRRIPTVLPALTGGGTWSTNTTYAVNGRRFGKFLELDYSVTLTGTPTLSTILHLNIPASLVIDTALLALATSSVSSLGSATFYDASGPLNSQFIPGRVRHLSTTTVRIEIMNDNTTAAHYYFGAEGGTPIVTASGDIFHALFRVPIVGWND